MAEMGDDGLARECRKGNWTVGETLILIEGKKMEEEEREKRRGEERERKATEPRWKWVENYCRRRGCLRSQNQCNDKWDNLMRDFRKVRDFERENGGLYWKMEKKERKERFLPTNMVFQVYEALLQVVEKKTVGVDYRPSVAALPPHPPPLPPPASAGYSLPPPPLQPFSHKRPRKRARRSMEEEEEGEDGRGAIARSAAVIVEALQADDERRERKHRDRVSVRERRLEIEESKTRIHSQGTSGLADAINKLADFISTLASHKTQPSSSK